MIVLSNHMSPVDIIYLSYIISPTFVKIVYKQKPANKKEVYLAPLEFMDTWKMALNLKGTVPIETDDEGFTKLALKKLSLIRLGEINHSEKDGGIVIFFEGAITNGEGILEINEDIATEIQNYRLKYSREPILVSLKHHDHPNTTVNNPLWTLILLMANLYNTVSITMTIPLKSNIFSGSTLAKEINNNFTNSHQTKILHTDYKEYVNFLDYWNATKKKNYTSAKNIKTD